MKRTAITLAAVLLTATAALGQSTETEQQKRDHEAGCVAGTVAGVLVGAAFGGIFGKGVGKTVMEVAGGSGGALVGHHLSCKNQ